MRRDATAPKALIRCATDESSRQRYIILMATSLSCPMGWTHRTLPEQSRASTPPRSSAAHAEAMAGGVCAEGAAVTVLDSEW
jgi:hypothetical protein